MRRKLALLGYAALFATLILALYMLFSGNVSKMEDTAAGGVLGRLSQPSFRQRHPNSIDTPRERYSQLDSARFGIHEFRRMNMISLYQHVNTI